MNDIPSPSPAKISPADLIASVLKGIVAGAAGILPGFSGGVMMLVFGIYEPLMYLFSHPLDGLKKFWKRLLPFVIGIAIGFVLTSLVLSKVFEVYEVQATCLFVGLILGMLPSLWRDAGEKGRNAGSFIALTVTAILAYALFAFLGKGGNGAMTPHFGAFVLCGVLCGLSLIVPGMSFSSPMMMLGLYTPFNEAVGSLDFTVLLPCAIGFVAIILTLSRLVTWLFDRFYNPARHAIIGIVLASTLPLLKQDYQGGGQIVLCVLLGLLGLGIALAADRFEQKTKASHPTSSTETKESE